ncbi:MAG TPA: PAS domain S-box protein [Bacteroidota bacterium]|nr:PAS domain S-box protein [Bacteroidota bacterium]
MKLPNQKPRQSRKRTTRTAPAIGARTKSAGSVEAIALRDHVWKNAAYGLVAIDMKGMIVDANRAFARMAGKSVRELIGASIASIGNKDLSENLLVAQHQVVLSKVRREDRVVIRSLKGSSGKRVECTLQGVIHVGSRPLVLHKVTYLADRQTEGGRGASSAASSKVLFEKSPSYVCLSKLNGELIDANDNLLALLGRPLNAVVGKTAVQLGLLTRKQFNDMRAALARRRDEVAELERVPWSPIGKRSMIVALSARVVEIQGSHCVLFIFTDRSTHYRLEDEIRSSEENYRRIVDESPDAILLVDEDGKIAEWNRSSETLIGFRRQEVIGKYYWDVVWNIMSEEHKTGEVLALLKKKTLSILRRGRLPRGADSPALAVRGTGVRGFDYQRTVVIKTSKGHRILTVIRDYSMEKRNQDNLMQSGYTLKGLFAATRAGVALVIDRKMVRVNESLCKLTGYTKDELNGQSSRMLYPSEEDFVRAGKALYDHPYGDGQGTEGVLKRKDGSLIDAFVYVSPFNADDPAAGVAVTVVDISGRKEAERALEASVEQLHTLAARLESIREEERKSLSMEVHDQLGQILSAVTMDLMAAKRLSPDPETLLGRKLNSAIELTDNAIAIVQDISSRLRPRMLDNLGLLAAIEWQAEEFGRRSGIRCSLKLPENEPGLDEHRATALFRIFQEAMTNIGRHAKASTVTISLAQSENEISLSIADDGIGISDADLKNPKSLGLLGIQERLRPFNGSSLFRRRPEGGTEVLVRIPRSN